MVLNRRNFITTGLSCGICTALDPLHASPLTPKLDLSHTQICGASSFPTWQDIIETKLPHPDAVQAVQWMTNAMGIEGNFTLLEGVFTKGNTAIAGTHSHYKGRFIVYDGSKLKWTKDNPDWHEISILGHEIGHHANGDTGVRNHGRGAWQRELKADETSGFLVARLGGTLEQAQGFFQTLSPHGNETHPPRHLRLQAVAKGWNRAEALKHWEKPTCQNSWIGASFKIRDTTCRLAHHCNPNDSINLACKDLLGDWIIQ